jgi:hypothetical protein
MCSIKEITIYAIACLLCGTSYSQSMMPSTSASISGGDEVRARDGTTCRQGTHLGPTFDVGVSMTPSSSTTIGTQASLAAQANSQLTNQFTQNQGMGVYARVVVPFGKPADRLDCTRLYSLEIERLQMELTRLKESGSAGVVVN